MRRKGDAHGGGGGLQTDSGESWCCRGLSTMTPLRKPAIPLPRHGLAFPGVRCRVGKRGDGFDENLGVEGWGSLDGIEKMELIMGSVFFLCILEGEGCNSCKFLLTF